MTLSSISSTMAQIATTRIFFVKGIPPEYTMYVSFYIFYPLL
jgi:hypothetical protein